MEAPSVPRSPFLPPSRISAPTSPVSTWFHRNNIHIPKPRHVAWVLEVLQELCKTKFLWLQLSTIEFMDDWCRSYLNFDKCNGWNNRIFIPNYIVLHSNTIEHRGYLNTPEEHEFTAYLLQRGLMLKTMRIHAKYSLESRFEIYETLSEIQRGSSMCRLEVN